MKISKKLLIVVLISLVAISLATVVNAGSNLTDLESYLTSAHTVCGKSYQLTADQKKVISDHLKNNGITDEQAGNALNTLRNTEATLNNTGASKLSDVPTQVKTNAIASLKAAGSAIDLNISVSTEKNTYTVTDKKGNALASGTYITDATGNIAASTSTYKILDGSKQVYNPVSCTDLGFRWDVDYALFENGGKVYVDDILVDPSCYTSRSGSTIIELKYAFLNTLKDGDHVIKAEYINGATTSEVFAVSRVYGSSPASASAPVAGAANAANSGKTFVYTGSNNVAYIVLSLLAVVAVSTVFVRKVYAK